MFQNIETDCASLLRFQFQMLHQNHAQVQLRIAESEAHMRKAKSILDSHEVQLLAQRTMLEEHSRMIENFRRNLAASGLFRGPM